MRNLLLTSLSPPQWWQRWRLRWRMKQVKRASAGASDQRPERALCEQLLLLLPVQQYLHYSASAGLSVYTGSMYANVEVYSKKLREVYAVVKQEKVIDPAVVAAEEVTMSVDRFLVSADGYYTNPVTAVANFRAAALQLCKAMRPADDQQFGVYEHNLRVLTRLFINLRFVTIDLIDVALAG